MSKNCVIMGRIKSNYESRSQTSLIRRIPVIMRIDGKAFHTYTKGLDKPFDKELMNDMDQTAIYLCSKIQGAKCAYVQSDEISILITDYDKLETDAWFDYNVQKMTSISASLATGIFNQLRLQKMVGSEFDHGDNKYLDSKYLNSNLANFDSRVFNIPKEEVANYFLARQKDAVKNSIASVAQHLYPRKGDLDNKNGNEQQEMIFQKGINWNDYTFGEKRGRFIIKNTYWNNELVVERNTYTDPFDNVTELRTENIVKNGDKYLNLDGLEFKPIIRTKWEVVETPLTFNNDNFNKWL